MSKRPHEYLEEMAKHSKWGGLICVILLAGVTVVSFALIWGIVIYAANQ